MNKWFLYIILKGKTYYTGITNHLAHRLKQHGADRALYIEHFKTKGEAARREREIKGWSRAKKEALWKGKL